jgi:hypothetical protein
MAAPDARFPMYDLDNSVQVARQIHERGAGGVASADELAAFLGYKSTNNGAYLSRVAAARLFGLIEGQSSAIKVTPRALDIIRPAHPQSAQRARLSAFSAVPLFSAFLENWEGKELPSHEHMRNALAGLGVPEKSTGSALFRLLESAEQAGLFRVAGNRTRMIRPTLGDMPAAVEAAEEQPGELTARTTGFPKLIEGALDALPAERQWDEDEFTEWLDFFERALRVHYRLPRRRAIPTS